MISVSILSKKNDYKNAVEKINKTNVDYLHLDIMDNTFTQLSSFSKDEVKEIGKINEKKLDIHLMSNNLDYWIDECIKLKPDIISIHFEALDNIDKYIEKIKENNILVGLAINPNTNISDISSYLSKIDVVLVMGVYAGKAGQKYIEDTTEKLIKLKKLKDKYNYIIEIDGGINNETVKKIKDYTDIIVSGSFITNSENYQEKINELNT